MAQRIPPSKRMKQAIVEQKTVQYVKWNVIQLRHYNQNRQLHQLEFIFS